MQTAVMNSEPVADSHIGNHPQKTMSPVAFITLTPMGKPFPKTDPLPLDCTARLDDHPAFTVLADKVNELPLVAPLIATAMTEETPPNLPELDPSSAEIAPFLLSARQQRAAEGEPSLKEVGHDFNDLPTEVALLKACIADPSETLRQIIDDINPEAFYSKRNRAIFLAVLYLVELGQTVSPAAVLGHLKDTEPDFGSDHVSYLDQICDVKYNPDHVVAYAGRLKRAVRVRGGEGYCKYEFSEPFSAYLLLQRVPNMHFLGDDLHIYSGGVWGKEDRKMFGADAMKCIHPRHQTAKHAQSVLDYVGMIRQVRKDTFHGAYKRTDDLIVINVNNGVLEVSPGGAMVFREHSKDDFFSLKLAANYNPTETCATFLSVLDDALPDKADRDALQVFAGYILYPGCDYEASLVCYGPGGTGKSTILNGIGNALGTSLCGKAGLEDLCKTSGYSLPTIRDKMLNLGTELNGTEIEESANFKKLVSGEGMLARQIYCEPGELVTTCKLTFLTNNMPRFKYGTDAEARRLRILHFSRKPQVQDPGLKAKINAETAGILAWMVQGLVRLLQQGEVPHGGVAAKRVLDTFNRGNDPVGSFVGSECAFDPNAVVSKRELFGAFDSWCQTHGLASGEKMENFFWKTLRQRHTLADTRLTSTSGHREHAIRGINLRIDPAAV